MIINKLENAFGIEEFKMGNVDKLKNCAIYSSNGIFKSSFANTMHKLNNNEKSEIKDRITDKSVKYDIILNGNQYKDNDNKLIENVIVYSHEIYKSNELATDNSLKQALLLPEQQKELTQELNNLNNIETELFKKISKEKLKINNRHDLSSLIKVANKERLLILKDFFNILLDTELKNIDFLDFTKLHQKTYEFLDDDKFKEQVTIYKNIINREIVSEVFDKKFNDRNFSTFLDAIRNSNFLSADRKIVINNQVFTSFIELETFIKEEFEKIKLKPEVKEQFDKIDKTIGNTKQSDILKELILNSETVQILDLGRKNLTLIKLKSLYKEEEIEELIEELNTIEKNIKNIINKSKEIFSSFEDAIKIYKERFNPKFDIEIKNIDNVRLGIEIPNIRFYHKDDKSKIKSYNEDELYNILSSGEKSALKILHFIVKYETMKASNPTIIFDDVIETFDYLNRSAFITYINDIKDDGSNIIVLTHNFDFYRTVISRSRLNQLVAIKRQKGVETSIEIQKNTKFEKSYLSINKISTIVELISALPILRELNKAKNECIEFTGLTNELLHFKERTSSISIKEIVDKISNEFIDIEIHDNLKYNEKMYLDELLNLSVGHVEPLELNKKLLLSIRCRILCEMIAVNKDSSKVINYDSNQTRMIYNDYSNDMNDEFKKLFEETLLITPSFIHYNSFMFEPLIDTNVDRLISIDDQLQKIYKSI